jgi:hypothetical protein
VANPRRLQPPPPALVAFACDGELKTRARFATEAVLGSEKKTEKHINTEKRDPKGYKSLLATTLH